MLYCIPRINVYHIVGVDEVIYGLISFKRVKHLCQPCLGSDITYQGSIRSYPFLSTHGWFMLYDELWCDSDRAKRIYSYACNSLFIPYHMVSPYYSSGCESFQLSGVSILASIPPCSLSKY